MTYYTLTPSGYVLADPQPVIVPEDETTPWGALLVLNIIRDVLGVEPGQNVIDAIRSLKPGGKCKTVVVPEGYMVVKREPDEKQQVCSHKEWIGYPAGFVPTSWRCCDCGTTITAGEMILYRSMTKAVELKPT